MRALRRHVVSRVLVCLLLAWTGADMLMPELCAAEASPVSASDGPLDSHDRDDCFCCCTHTQTAVLLVAVFVPTETTQALHVTADRIAPGVPRSLYHPPLHS
ncbi:MAG: hypothetical protein AB7K63_17005 [Vicinamibacterales bacterium]